MPSLLSKQKEFTRRVCRLLKFLDSSGYEVTFGEAFRPKELADFYAAKGKGIASSLHMVRLAVDLNLFRNGKYLTESEAYRDAGEFWESLSDDEYECCWGGRFNDGNHFSIGHNGVK
jgi:hypothetical protein